MVDPARGVGDARSGNLGGFHRQDKAMRAGLRLSTCRGRGGGRHPPGLSPIGRTTNGPAVAVLIFGSGAEVACDLDAANDLTVAWAEAGLVPAPASRISRRAASVLQPGAPVGSLFTQMDDRLRLRRSESSSDRLGSRALAAVYPMPSATRSLPFGSLRRVPGVRLTSDKTA